MRALVAAALLAGCGAMDEPQAGPDAAPVEEEQQPEPAGGAGHSDPPSLSLHNRGCGGIDWQRIHGWLLHPHAAPELGSAGEIERCVARYAGWVTHEADAAGVSRASVYAALAASGQCADGGGYDGRLVAAGQCTQVHPELEEGACQERMAASRGFGIATLSRVLGGEAAVAEHRRDIPLMAAYLGNGSVRCGGDDRWKLAAPPGYIDHYVAAYNAAKALSAEPPACDRRIVVTVALYTGMDVPGVDGVAAGNGCWTFERVAKSNAEWKICNYDGTVHHAGGVKWVYDDTSSGHVTSTEVERINSCKAGVPGRGYVYMANRGGGWPKRVTGGVEAHFAEVYSSQYQVDDQFGQWLGAGAPGHPMIHLGEPSTDAARIGDATRRACQEVGDGGYLGIYVYPASLRGDRMSAMVRALNACTGS